MKRPKSSGMLQGGKNLLEMPCKEINRSVPFFKEILHGEKTPNEVVFDFFEAFSDEEINFSNKLQTLPGLEKIPDGILQIHSANEKHLSYKV